MTEKELNEVKKILGLDDLKNDIKDLRKEFRELDRKISTFWYKITFVLISFIIMVFLGEILVRTL